MFWITQILKNSQLDQRRQIPGRSMAGWLDELNERFLLYRTVQKERVLLARMSDEQLRDIGLHRADADHESQRNYFDLPKDRE